MCSLKRQHGSYTRNNSLNLADKRTMKSLCEMLRNSVSLQAPIRPKTFAMASLTCHSSDAGWESMKETWYGVWDPSSISSGRCGLCTREVGRKCKRKEGKKRTILERRKAKG